jgi:hypothetical protein
VTPIVLRVVVALTRGWLRLYTCRMPQHLSAARRAEIESDLWEMQHDPDFARGVAGASIALARLVAGVPHDVVWRFENAAIEEQFIVRRVVALSVASVLVLSLWPMPSVFGEGHRRLAACAAATPRPNVLAALQHEVIRCAGSFFSAPRSGRGGERTDDHVNGHAAFMTSPGADHASHRR